MKIDPEKYKLYESALIKAIRRNLTGMAGRFTGILCLLGHEDLVWRRIFIHLSEDIGPANESLPASVFALYQSYELIKNTKQASYESGKERFFPILHAVLLLCLSQKSRVVNDGVICFFNEANLKDEIFIPDFCYDFHSPLGKRMGRDLKHYLEEGAKIENETKEFENVFKDWAKIILKENDKLQNNQ